MRFSRAGCETQILKHTLPALLNNVLTKEMDIFSLNRDSPIKLLVNFLYRGYTNIVLEIAVLCMFAFIYLIIELLYL